MFLRCSGCTDLEKCKAQAVPITPTKCGGERACYVGRTLVAFDGARDGEGCGLFADG